MYALLIAAFFLQSPEIPQLETQFGVPMGASLEWVLEELETTPYVFTEVESPEKVNSIQTRLENMGVRVLETSMVPDPNPLFESFTIWVQDDVGVCMVDAKSREMVFDEAMALYIELKRWAVATFPDYRFHDSEYGFFVRNSDSPTMLSVGSHTDLFRFPEQETQKANISFVAANKYADFFAG